MDTEKKRIIWYIALVFLLAALLCAALALNQRFGLIAQDVALAAASILFMFFPLLCAVLTMAITREGFSAFRRAKPKFVKNWKWYLLAGLLPGVLVIFGAAAYFLVFPDCFDLSMPMIANAQTPLPITVTPALLALIALVLVITAQFVVINHVVAFGEEFGWRGYLLPKLMRKMSAPRAVLCTGALWGLAHFPLTVFGHNYGLGGPLHPVLPILMMTLFATVFGVFLSYLTIRTGSVIPASVAHGALNAVGGAAVLFVTADGYRPLLGPNVAGLFGMSGALILAVVLLVRLRADITTDGDFSGI